MAPFLMKVDGRARAARESRSSARKASQLSQLSASQEAKETPGVGVSPNRAGTARRRPTQV